jgi:hypothetical protein
VQATVAANVSLIRVKGGERELVGQPSPEPALIPALRMN